MASVCAVAPRRTIFKPVPALADNSHLDPAVQSQRPRKPMRNPKERPPMPKRRHRDHLTRRKVKVSLEAAKSGDVDFDEDAQADPDEQETQDADQDEDPEAYLVEALRVDPAAILLQSRDIFRDSIAERFCACFPGVSHKYRVMCIAEWGIALACQCETKHQGKGGGESHHLRGVLRWLRQCRATGGVAGMPSPYRAIWGQWH